METKDTTLYCAKHPKVETALTCASCGTPICPKCMVSTPVGMKCPQCGTSKGSPLYKVAPGRLALAALTAMIGGAVSTLISGMGFFVIFLSIPYGYFLGNMILKASGMKRGRLLEILAGAMIIVGATLANLTPDLLIVSASGAPAGIPILPILLRSISCPYFLLAVGVTTACAVSKIRYL